jgi:hypothetical protein
MYRLIMWEHCYQIFQILGHKNSLSTDVLSGFHCNCRLLYTTYTYTLHEHFCLRPVLSRSMTYIIV